VSELQEFEERVRAAGMEQAITKIITAYVSGEVGEDLSAEAFDTWANKRNRPKDQVEVASDWWERSYAMRATVLEGVSKKSNAPAVQEKAVETPDEGHDVSEEHREEAVKPAKVPQKSVKERSSRKKMKKVKDSDDDSINEESDNNSEEDSSEDDKRTRKKNPNERSPIIFLTEEDVRRGMALDRAGRKLQRKRQKIFFTAKTNRFQTTYQLEKRLPDGMSYGGALLILTQGRFPLQCFKTETNFDPSGRKYSQVKDHILKYATPFESLSDWTMAQDAFAETLIGMNKFEEEGLFKYERHAMRKFKEIVNAHQTVPNGKGVAFQKFLIFETEVRNMIEDNDMYEWGDLKVWQDVAAKKYPNVRDIATSTPFRPTEAWHLEDGSVIAADSARGRSIGSVTQSSGVSHGFQNQGMTQETRGPSVRGGAGMKRGMRGGFRSEARGRYQSAYTHEGQGQQESADRAPCERFNKGICVIPAERCRFAHYCAEYRNYVGKGCGPKANHPYATHLAAATTAAETPVVAKDK